MRSLAFPAGRLPALVTCSCLAATVAAQGIRANAPLMGAPGLQGEDVRSFAPVPDEDLVLFLADPEDGDRFEVFVAPVDRSAARRRLSAAGSACSGLLRAASGVVAFLQHTPSGSAPRELGSRDR